MMMASDLRLNVREFNPRPHHYRSVGAGMGDRLWADTSHPGQLSLLPSVRREMLITYVGCVAQRRSLTGELSVCGSNLAELNPSVYSCIVPP